MSHFIKRTIFIVGGALNELFAALLLLLLCVTAKIICLKKNTIFFGMMHINNLTYGAQAMRSKGYTVQVVPFMIPDHEVDVIPYDVNLRRKYPLLYFHFIGHYILTFWVFIWSIFNFHIFVMPFRTRILDRTVWLKFFEIPLLHLAGKKVILNTYGGDVATPRLKRRHDLKYSLYDGYIADPRYCAYDEEAIARNTRRLEKQADFIISAIDHVDYLERVDEYFHLRCIDTHSIHPHYSVQNQSPVFVHAPNHRLVKGTDKIIEVIDSLNKRGFPCELKIVENTSNAELLEIIKESDGVIDQLLLGTYARLAIEAMALGKPVFCYLRKDLYKFNPIWTNCPIINVDPDNLEDELELFLKSAPEEKLKIGKKSREYVEQYHSLEYVGYRFDTIIQKVLKS